VPLPRRIAEFNRDVTNKVGVRLAGQLPPFAIVEHVGRMSGTAYRTPVMVFSRPGGYAIALTYGPRTDWVRNVLAAGGCTIVLGGASIPLASPALDHGAAAIHRFPPMIRTVLRLLGIEDVLLLKHKAGTDTWSIPA
jgi:deazaflavin-dependent oxidoreductase (nitroreductase family)